MKSYILLVALGLMLALPAQAEPAQGASNVDKGQVEKKFLNAFWNDAVVSQAVVDVFSNAQMNSQTLENTLNDQPALRETIGLTSAPTLTFPFSQL